MTATCMDRGWRLLAQIMAWMTLALLAACGGDDGDLPVVAPTITAQPADTQVTAGSAVRFSVAVDGTDASYQWQRSTDGGTTWTAIAGATSASYTLAAPTVADSGSRFRVLVSRGTAQTISSAVTLTVSALAIAPAITVQPQPAQVTAGGNASFSVTATGTTLAYRWQTSSDGSTWADAAAGSTATLALNAVALFSNQLQVRVIVSNSLASITSSPARLTVLEPPVAPAFTRQPAAATVMAPATATFTVAAGGTPAPTLQWQRSTDGGATYTTIAGATAGSYTTPATSLADSGTRYRAVATNATAAVNSDAAVLTVTPALAAPAWTSQPADATVAAGAAVSFSATASGNPVPALQWQVSTDGGATFANINGATAATYALTAAAASDNGRRYRVVATNSQGSITSRAAVLTVTAALAAPTFASEPADVTVAAGAQVSFSAVASGNPTPALQWQVSIDGGATFTNISGATAASFGGPTIAGDNGRRYRVVATNSQGSASSRAALLTVTAVTAPASSLAGRGWTLGQRAATGTASLLFPWTSVPPVSGIDDQGRLTTLYRSVDTGTFTENRLWAIRSVPGGAGASATLGAPVLLQQGTNTLTLRSSIDVSPAGNALASWLTSSPCEADATRTCSQLRVARYLASTNAWETPVTVSGAVDFAALITNARINDAGDILLYGSLVTESRLITRANGQSAFRVQTLPATLPSVALDSSGNFVVASVQVAADSSQNIAVWRGNLRSGALSAAETLDTRSSPASLMGVWSNPTGRTVVLWSQNNGVQVVEYGAALDTPDGSWVVTDTGVPHTTNSAYTGITVTGTVTDAGDFVSYLWLRCTMLRRVNGSWVGETSLPAGSCNDLGSLNTSVARNGNVLLLQPSTGRWSTIDAARQEVVSNFTNDPSGPGYVLGLPWNALPGQVLLSSSGIGAYVSVNTFDVLPTSALPAGDSRGVNNLWNIFFK